MPNEPWTTTLDEDVLGGFLDFLKNPYPKDHDDLIQTQEAVDESLQAIIHSLLDIPGHVQPLFPLRSLLTEPRARHLTCEQARAASAYFHLLVLEANMLWVLGIHYLVRAHTLDNTIRLPANRAEALTFWDIPEDPLDDRNHDPDLSGYVQAHFLIAAHQSPEQILEEGPDFTLRVEGGDVVLRVVLREQPPAFIFSKTLQEPETGAVTDPHAWGKISTRRLADVPGLAKRFRRHHRQDVRRAHTFIWPQDFLPLMTTLDDLENPDRHKLMVPSYQDYLARKLFSTCHKTGRACGASPRTRGTPATSSPGQSTPSPNPKPSFPSAITSNATQPTSRASKAATPTGCSNPKRSSMT